MRVQTGKVGSQLIGMVLALGSLVQVARASLVWDFWPTNANGWTVVPNGTADANYTNGDGGGVGPANSGGGRAHDGDHDTFIFQSPEFWFDGSTLDGTNIMTWTTAGGAGDQSSHGPDYFVDEAAVLAFNGGNSNSDGQKGLAFLNTTTDVYDAVLFKQGNGGTYTYDLTAADLTTAGVTLAQGYRLQYYENDEGGWGWGQLNLVGLAATPLPPVDATLTSVATSDWHLPGTWTGGPPDVPTDASVAQVHNGYTVTVAAGNPGEARNVDVDATSMLQVNDTLTVGDTVQVDGTLGVGSAGTLDAGGAVGVSSGATLHLDNGGTVTAPSIDLGAGATLLSSGAQTMPANVAVDPDSTIHVASGTLSVNQDGLPAGAYSHYTFDGTTVDSGSLGNAAGTLTGGAGYGTGVLGQALSLSGNNADYFDTNQDAPYDLRTSDLSFSLWAKLDADGWNDGWEALIAKGEGNTWRLARDGTNDPQLQYGNNWIAAPADLEDSEWHHLAVTHAEGGTSALWFDGTVVGAGGGNISDDRASDLWIGNNPQQTGRSFGGLIDEVVIYTRVLTDDEIQALYGGGLNGAYKAVYGNLQVDAGATLRNDGDGLLSFANVSGAGTVESDVEVRSVLAPGNSIGTLTVVGDLELASGAVLGWEALSATEYDQVNIVGGDLMLNDWILRLDLTGSADGPLLPDDRLYLFAGYDALGNGLGVWSIDASPVNPAFWNVSGAYIGADDGGIFVSGLMGVPEPSTLLLGLCGLAALAVHRRRR